ncbi:hypothetical protein AB0B12_38010 [Streptomyces sp. NPDC044780]|uniref:hypothetical protein n=1 Tax=unclassified Streptomyces TaxID=2593676 RepID=UPI0033C6CA36
MTRPFLRRCGHGPGELHPADQAVVTAFKTMLEASKQPTPWTEDDDLAVQVPTGVERARLQPHQQPNADTVDLVLLHPDTQAVLTQPMPCPRSLILGPWDQAYRPLTHTAQGKEITDPRRQTSQTGLNDPALCCPKCHGTELQADILRYRHGGADVSGFSCLQCAAAWEPWEAPQFPAPDYAAAYADAPPLAEEESELVLLADEINDRAMAALTGDGPSVPTVDHRLLLLRKAAWLDRAAHEREVAWYLGGVPAAQVNQGTAWAVQAAHALQNWDLQHDQNDVAGPTGPSSPAWNSAGGARAYVRQEYHALLDRAREADDRAQMEPRRGPDGELYDATGQPL